MLLVQTHQQWRWEKKQNQPHCQFVSWLKGQVKSSAWGFSLCLFYKQPPAAGAAG